MRKFLPLRHVRVNNLKIAVGNMREGRSAVDVAKRPYAGHIRFQPVIYFDEAEFISLDSRFFQIKIIGVRLATNGHQEMRS